MTLGILGGGQLGRMLALAGIPLGESFAFVDRAPDCPSAPVGTVFVGPYDDPDALAKLAAACEVVTYEFESVPVEAVRQLEALGARVYPPAGALAVAQDRFAEKSFFARLGIPTADFADVTDEASLAAAVARFGAPCVLKTRRFGYDGKGQFVLRDPSQVGEAWAAVGKRPSIVERFVPFDRELSILTVRAPGGDAVTYALVENHHAGGILRVSYAPAPNVSDALQAQAAAYAERITRELDYVGVLALELFDVKGELVANEMAPRVHNSGHWTIEGAETSQFENHVRAVLGWPLGSTACRGVSAMVNLIGTMPDPRALAAAPGAHVHVYGKEPAPGRKLGHVTLRADAREALVQSEARVRAIVDAAG